MVCFMASLFWKRTYPRSRLLITTIPASMYVFNEDGINLSLQAAGEIIVDSMNQLSTTGVAVRNIHEDEASSTSNGIFDV